MFIGYPRFTSTTTKELSLYQTTEWTCFGKTHLQKTNTEKKSHKFEHFCHPLATSNYPSFTVEVYSKRVNCL